MTTPAAILDTIDNAIADYELSADAMRWTPDAPPPATGGPLTRAAEIARAFDVPESYLTMPRITGPTPEQIEDIRQRFAAAMEPLCRQLAQIGEAMKGVSFSFGLLDEVWLERPRRRERVTRMRRAYRAKRRGW